LFFLEWPDGREKLRLFSQFRRGSACQKPKIPSQHERLKRSNPFFSNHHYEKLKKCKVSQNRIFALEPPRTANSKESGLLILPKSEKTQNLINTKGGSMMHTVDNRKKRKKFWQGILLLEIIIITAFILSGCTQPLQSKIENCPPGKAAYVCGAEANITFSYNNITGTYSYICRPVASFDTWSSGNGYPQDGVGCLRRGLRCCWTDTP